MIYFRKNGNTIVKYIVCFDEDQIKKLKSTIIDKCSFIEHIEFKSDYSPRLSDIIVKNFKSIPTSQTKDYFEETRRVYLYTYDKYTPPYLVKLITNLLNGDAKAIDEILNYNYTSNPTIDERIISINEDFNTIAPEEIDKKKKKLKELEELLKAKELNEKQESIDNYYQQLLRLINFELVDTISIDELNRIETFFGIDLSSKVIINNDDSFIKHLVKTN